MNNDLQAVIASLKADLVRLQKENREYYTVEKVLVAAGHVSEDVVQQAHEIVRSLKEPTP